MSKEAISKEKIESKVSQKKSPVPIKKEKEDDKNKSKVQVKEIIEEKSKEITEEDLEEIVESLSREDNSINEFLANQWRPVSLEGRTSGGGSNFSTNIFRQQFPEEDDKKIEYEISKLENKGKYVPAEIDTYEDKNVSAQEEIFREQKRLYLKPTKLRPDGKIEEDLSIKYVRPEDTVEKNYLSRKKFNV